MKRRYLSSVLVAVATLVLAIGAACGGGDDSSPKPNTGAGVKATGAAKSTSTPAGAGVKAAAVIDQVDMKFTPEKVTVKVGETVLIKNSEAVIHTANVNNKNITGNMKKGDSKTWKAQSPGDYKITCDYHPLMKATIVVTQ